MRLQRRKAKRIAMDAAELMILLHPARIAAKFEG
jgi:hypothetical protein